MINYRAKLSGSLLAFGATSKLREMVKAGICADLLASVCSVFRWQDLKRGVHDGFVFLWECNEAPELSQNKGRSEDDYQPTPRQRLSMVTKPAFDDRKHFYSVVVVVKKKVST